MARHRLVRWLATAGLVFLTSTGIVVSSAQTSAALEWGPTDRAAARALIGTFQRGGVKAASPGTMARLASRCVGTTVAAVGCTAGVAGIGVGAYALYETRDRWIPWLEAQMDDGSNTTTAPGACAKVDITDEPALMLAKGTGASGTLNYVDFKYRMQQTGDIQSCHVGFDMSVKWRHDNGASGAYGPVNVNTEGIPRQPGYMDRAQRLLLDSAIPTGAVVTQVVLTGKYSSFGGMAPSLTWDRPAPVGSGETTSSVNCRRPDGSGYTVNRSSIPVDGHVIVASCDPGDVIEGMTAGGTSVDLRPSDADKSQFPECVKTGAGCVYRVVIDGEACAGGVYNCVHWTRIAQASPSRVECHYGPYVLPLSYCSFLERSYSLTADDSLITKDNTDGNPDTVTGTPTTPAWDPTKATPPKVFPTPITTTSPQPDPTVTPYPSPGSPSPTASPSPSPTATSSPSPTETASPSPSPSPSTSPTAGPSGPTLNCTTPYALGAVKPVTAIGVNYLGPLFDIATVGGVRDDPIPDHPSGLAADFMTSDPDVGDQLSRHAQQKAATLNVQYIIWSQKIWNVDRASEGWRAMEDRGSPTANHMDHVHITFKDAVPGTCTTDPGDPTPTQGKDNCWPSGWGVFNPAGWVLQPTKCAMEWAFVPRPGELQKHWAGVQTKWGGATPTVWSGAVTGLADSFDVAGGTCQGPALAIGEPFNSTSYPFSACASPMSTIALVVKAGLSILVVATGAMACVRALSSGLNYGGVS